MKNSEAKDRRIPVSVSRKEIENRLSLDQLVSLRQLESFGWGLRFIRQPLFQNPVPVVFQANKKAVGILEEDGRLNISVDIQTRQEPG